MLDLSIVIPVYNGEKYLDRCLKSIYDLKLDEGRFEVVIVDDCSTDGTPGLIRKWSRDYGNIVSVRHEVNKKIGGARNSGFSIAKGKYIYFADADDEIADDLKVTLELALSTESDIILNNIAYQNEQNGPFLSSSYDIPKGEMMTGKEFCEQYYSIVWHGAVYSSIFKKSFLSALSVPFIENRTMEDVDWTEKILAAADSIVYSGICIYKYYINHGSTLHNGLNARLDADKVGYCYRRMIYADKISSDLPNFTDRIYAHCTAWVNAIFSFRHLSRFRYREYCALLVNIPADEILYFSSCNRINGSVRFLLSHLPFSRFMVAICNPMASFARFAVHTFQSVN